MEEDPRILDPCWFQVLNLTEDKTSSPRHSQYLIGKYKNVLLLLCYDYLGLI